MNWIKLENIIEKTLISNRKIIFLVGAGLSAASGIPTFRGKEGFWKEGSRNYMPQEIGTFKMFRNNPDAVWNWFLFRKSKVKNAKPNAGHLALKQIEDCINDQFVLVTQNVDGLHRKAGNSQKRMYKIHGDFVHTRCSNECSDQLVPYPDNLKDKKRGDTISVSEKLSLTCKRCGFLLRPHVLWFDECYNEKYYHIDTVISFAEKAGLLFVIGTSGATTLPSLVVDIVRQNNLPIMDINLEDNEYMRFLKYYNNCYPIRDNCEIVLPKIAEIFKAKRNN